MPRRRRSNSGSGRDQQLTLTGFGEEVHGDPDSSDQPGRSEPTSRGQTRQAVRIDAGSLPDVLSAPVTPAEAEPLPDLAGKLVVVVDAHSLIYQVFHALPPMTSTGGLPVSAVYGFAGDMLELIDRKQPDYLIAAFDKSAITFRNDLYDQYKANRDPMPDELRQQIPLVRQAVDALGIGVVEMEGFEADDLLATIAKITEQAGGDCLVVTSDKDCRQLITDHVKIYNIRKDLEMDAAKLWETWGVRPDQVVDFQALVGDAVDNVPGVPLIGPKIARSLLEEHGTLEAVLDNADSVSGKKRKQNLKEGRQLAMLSRQLVKLRDDVDFPIAWSRSTRTAIQPQRAKALFKEFGFRSLTSRVEELIRDIQGDAPEADWQCDYRCVSDIDSLRELTGNLATTKRIAIDTETTSTNPRISELVGISLAWRPGQAAYLPLMSPEGAASIAADDAIDLLRPLLEDPSIEKVGHNLKFDVVVLRAAGVNVRGVTTDTMVADYLLNPGGRNHTLDDLSRRYLAHTPVSIKELIGSGKRQLTMDQVPLADITHYACEDADVPLRIACQVESELEEQTLDTLFTDVEMPLIDVLAEMEFNGITVDAEYLGKMSREFSITIDDLRDKLHQLAGRIFNPDSPKQLAEVMFDELKLPVVKKTKTGKSTDAGVLQQLAVDHEFPATVMEYRQATKLKNTYIDALPELINPKTHRVHTSFRQDVAATGRLSSSEPNLQNIPIRTEQGRAIRGAFQASPEGWLLLGADYSQIELRVLAHASGDPALQKAYHDDADIHTRVAAEVNQVDESEVTSDMRRVAKTINFGIVYGQSPFGLAKTLGISKAEARDYIEMYFERYQGVEQFMLDTLVRCRRNGYVSTILGRRRDVAGVRDLINLEVSKRRSLTEAERIAVNTPIQGSAADLIKLAMLAVHKQLSRSDLQARLLLQIHDELLFEVAPEDCQRLEVMVRDEMTNVMQLDVPLKVDIAVGKNWADT